MGELHLPLYSDIPAYRKFDWRVSIQIALVGSYRYGLAKVWESGRVSAENRELMLCAGC